MTFIVKVPGINGLGKTKGCENAGNEILKVLKNEIYSNEKGNIVDFDNLDLEEIHLDNDNIFLSNKFVYENSFKIFENLGKLKKVIFLGGDHSISYSLTRAFFDFCQGSSLSLGKEPCLIVFDAHPDCMSLIDSKENLNKSENKKSPTHEEWLRALIEDGFPTENILLVGVRNSYFEEINFLKKNNIRMISMNQLLGNLEDSCDIIMEFSKDKNLYVSIDIDVIDPCFAPATGYKEPGGLTSREFIYLIQRINKIKNLKALDIVEINPIKEGNKLTIKLGAKILAEIL